MIELGGCGTRAHARYEVRCETLYQVEAVRREGTREEHQRHGGDHASALARSHARRQRQHACKSNGAEVGTGITRRTHPC